MQTFFWAVYDIFRNEEPDFTRGRHHGSLSKFRLRGIYAIDSTTIQLAFWCIDWAKHRQRKAAVKVHMVANVANWLPHFCVFGKAKDHDSKMEDELFSSLKAGDIGIGDAVFAGFREDVPEVCGIAERRFAGRWRRESSHATENGIS